MWRCTARNSQKCNAKILVDAKDEVISCEDEHTHPPTKHQLLNKGFHYVKTASGAMMILYNKYSFIRGQQATPKDYWQCSAHSSNGCKAKLFISADDKILGTSHNHNHPASEHYFV